MTILRTVLDGLDAFVDAKLAEQESGGSTTLVPNEVPALTSVGAVGSGGGIYDTGSIYHTIECDAATSSAKLAFRYSDTNFSDFFESNQIGSTQVRGTQRINGNEYNNFPNPTDLGFTIAAGDVLGGEESPLGARVYIKRAGSEIWSSPFQNGGSVPMTTKVALLPGTAVTGLKHGPLLNPLYFDYVDFDSFTRKVKARIFYSHAAGSTAPADPQVQFGGSGPWYPMSITNSIKGQADVECFVPSSVSGWQPNSKLRWGNLPSLVQRAFDVDVGLPFAGMIGANVDAARLSDRPTLDDWLLRAVDGPKPGKQIGNDTYNVSPNDPNYVRGVPLGGTGGVQMQQVTLNAGDFGRNDLGITKYSLRMESAYVSSADAGAYTCRFPAGLEVVAQSGTTLGIGWAYNQSTGIGTFTLTAGQAYVLHLYITVSTIASGTLVPYLPTVPKLNAIGASVRVNPTLIDTWEKPLSDGIRPLDGLISYNNRGNGTTTKLFVGENSPATEPAYNTDIEIAVGNALGGKMQWVFNTQLDTPAQVRVKARRFALETPAGRKMFVSSGPNEVWNYLFTAPHSYNIMGLRAGLHTVANASAPRTPRTIWDAVGTTVAQRAFADGTPGPGQYIRFNEFFPANTAFYISVNGGYIVYKTLVDTPAGSVYAYDPANAGTSTTLALYEASSYIQSNEWSVRAGRRAYAEKTMLDREIWRDEFAAAGRLADVEYVLDAQTINNSVDDILAWGNLITKIERIAYGPYFNGGLFGLNWFDYANIVWDDTSRAMLAADNLTGAVEYMVPRMIPLYRASITKTLQALKREQYAENVAAGLAPDAVKLIFYEFGDHTYFTVPENFPNGQARGYAFHNAFLAHPLYEIFSAAYYEAIADQCVPGFLYSTKAGERTAFNLAPTFDSTSMSGPTTTDWTYRAWRKTVAKTRAVAASAP